MVYNFTNALMVTLLAFILLQNACRWRIIPVLFPNGKIREQTGAPHLNIRGRFIILYAALCLLPMFQIALIINTTGIAPGNGDELGLVIKSFQRFSLIIFIFTAIYGLWLSWLFSRNMAAPIHRIIRTTERIRSGDLEARARVLSNDEIGLLGDRVNDMASGLKESRRLKEVFDLFASPEVSVEILSRKELQGGEIRDVTLLFSDLRGFTTLAEAFPPQQVVQTINAYFEAMSDAIVSCGGIVLQYVGDEIEAVFGAPVDDPNHADKAVAAALAMRTALEQLNRQRALSAAPALKHGVGVHTGKALAGIVGGKHKISYAMVGDTVNLASRIQELNKQLGGDILISGQTYRALTVHRKVKGPLKLCVQGKTRDVEVYRLLA
jgi:class 3 adenylate cyclase